MRLLVCTLLAIALTSTTPSVPWTEVRTAVSAPICVLAYSLPDGSEGHNAVTGMRESCKLPPADTPLERAVDKAYERARPLTASLQIEGLSAAYDKELSHDERTRRAREVYLASEDFLRAVVPRLRDALATENLVCMGCPEFRPRPVRRLNWAEFAPYLAAHVWPDPVQTPTDSKGKSAGRPNFSFHVCGGLNGVAEMKDPDASLVRAGFVAAYQNRAFLQRAGTAFGEALSASEFSELTDDEARTRYLRRRVPSATVMDPVARAAACHVLVSFKAELGLEISDCAIATSETH